LAFIASFMAVPVINRIGLKKHLETSTWNPVPEEDRQ